MALADSINGVINNWAFKCQRGFIRGREMLQNVIEIEAKALSIAWNSKNRGALLFFDFATSENIANFGRIVTS